MSDKVDILKLLQQQREYQQTQYWSHFSKLLLINLILLALPHFINKTIVTTAFLHWSPIMPIVLSVFAFFGLKGELARLHYTTLRVTALFESISDALNERDEYIELFTRIPPLKATNRWYSENFGLILFVLIVACSIFELFNYDWIFAI